MEEGSSLWWTANTLTPLPFFYMGEREQGLVGKNKVMKESCTRIQRNGKESRFEPMVL